MNSLLLATDLDRTLLPNGHEPNDNGIDALFHAISTIPHTLVYVTGRNIKLVRDAEQDYGIPTPDYLIAEVGTSMFRKTADNTLVPEPRWVEYVQSHEEKWNQSNIVNAIGIQDGLTLQEEWKQNQFKISYYLSDHTQKEAALKHIHDALAKIEIDADVLWSIDPLKDNIGLVDVLPKTATKATALEFLRKQEHCSRADLIYCGDSGNDVLPLTQCYRSILVKNAPDEVKKEVQKRVTEKGCADMLYIASGSNDRNGNYASGILEGLQHFGII